MKIINKYLKQLYETGLGLKDRPKGWTLKSVKKAGKTIAKNVGLESPKEKEFFDKCVNRMRKSMGDKAEGYCASLKDRFMKSTFWRGKGKTKKEVEKDIEKHKNI